MKVYLVIKITASNQMIILGCFESKYDANMYAGDSWNVHVKELEVLKAGVYKNLSQQSQP